MDQALIGFVAAGVSGVVSLLIGVITVVVSRATIRAEREKLERELQRTMTARLYDVRLEVYPEAITVTEALRRSQMAAQGENLGEAYFKEVLARLDAWHATRAGFIMSLRSLDQLYTLRKALRQEPELEGRYSEEQVERIAVAKGDFRMALRRDIQLLYEEEIWTKL